MNISEILAKQSKEEIRRRYNRLYQRDRRAGERAARWLETMARIEKQREKKPN